MSQYIINKIDSGDVPNAPTGKYNLFLDSDGIWKKKDDTGVVTLVSEANKSIYTGSEIMTQNAFVDGTGSAYGITFANIGGFGVFTAAPSDDITFTAGGDVVLQGLVYPKTDGAINNVLSTDGAGNLSFRTVTEALKTKSGVVLAGAFSGNPKRATVTFATPFTDANYSVSLIETTSLNKNFNMKIDTVPTASGFTISMGANNITNLVDVRWIAIKHGEN